MQNGTRKIITLLNCIWITCITNLPTRRGTAKQKTKMGGQLYSLYFISAKQIISMKLYYYIAITYEMIYNLDIYNLCFNNKIKITALSNRSKIYIKNTYWNAKS